MFFFIVICLLLVLATGYVRTFFLEMTPNQRLFSSGKVPDPLPDGLHSGSAEGYSGSWQGKKFDRGASTGINLFKLGDKVEERYPFITSVGKGVKDDKDVIKIDYNIPQNPWYLRMILDEIVEVKPDEYLGKLHLRIIPGAPFTLAYFKLSKTQE